MILKLSNSLAILLSCFLSLASSTHAQMNSSRIDALIRQAQATSSPRIKVALLRRIAWEIRRPTMDQIRKLSGILRADKNAEVRCAAAAVFGKSAQAWRRRNPASNTPIEVAHMLDALRQAFTFERDEDVRICIVTAAAEFDSDEALVTINLGKSDIHPKVRRVARAAERMREQRLRWNGHL